MRKPDIIPPLSGSAPLRLIRLSALKARRAALILLAAVVVFQIALRLTPFPAALQTPAQLSTEFVDRHGRPLRSLLVDERRYARDCALGDVSPQLIAATLSAEDQRFYSHGGVDLRATARALFDAIRQHAPTSGASTITQQLVKLSDPAPRTLGQKLSEIWLALRVEQVWDKPQILSTYLNRLDYGNLQTGIASASRYYFGKPPQDLSAAEAAFLAALPKAPGRLNPHLNFADAKARQQWILRRMHDDQQLDAAALQRALVEPLRLIPHNHEFEAPHFVDLLLMRRGLIPARGGPLRTTLDLELNRFAENSLNENLRRLADKHAGSGAVVVIDNPTGEVLALAGAGNYFQAGDGQINTAWMLRSPGSTMKPFSYLLALQNGAHPCTVVADIPSEFATPTGLYRPNNYNHRFYGPVSLRFALGNSLNVAAIRVLQLAGGPEALQRALIQTGVTSLDQPADYYGLGLTLGNGELRLLELANAYATLARLGEYRPYRFLLHETPAPARRVFARDPAFLLADMLSDNSARAASFGLDSYLSFDFPVACKTGTSSDYRDNWTVGYTPEFTVAVWVGNPDGSRMLDITGVTGAAPVMHEVFEHLRARFGTSWYKTPAAIKSYPIDPLTGRLAAPERPGVCSEKCLSAPEPIRASDYDAAGRLRLDTEYAPWLAGPQNALGSLAVAAPPGAGLRIIQPKESTTYYLDGDLPLDSQWIALQAESPNALIWECPSLRIEKRDGMMRAQLAEGRHSIVVRDAVTGEQATTWIQIAHW